MSKDRQIDHLVDRAFGFGIADSDSEQDDIAFGSGSGVGGNGASGVSKAAAAQPAVQATASTAMLEIVTRDDNVARAAAAPSQCVLCQTAVDTTAQSFLRHARCGHTFHLACVEPLIVTGRRWCQACPEPSALSGGTQGIVDAGNDVNVRAMLSLLRERRQKVRAKSTAATTLGAAAGSGGGSRDHVSGAWSARACTRSRPLLLTHFPHSERKRRSILGRFCQRSICRLARAKQNRSKATAAAATTWPRATCVVARKRRIRHWHSGISVLWRRRRRQRKRQQRARCAVCRGRERAIVCLRLASRRLSLAPRRSLPAGCGALPARVCRCPGRRAHVRAL